MPHPDTKGMHMLSGHHVTGVNWRPIRFTKDLPPSLVCCLCRVVPETTAMLPCSHALCESCRRARRRDGHDTCPLDRKPYSTHTVFYAADQASSIKAHCWNEGYGCKYVGPIEALVLHYDKECTFHAIQCQRCEQRILRTNIAAHYEAGCHLNASCPSYAELNGRTGLSASSNTINSAISSFENSIQRRIEQIEANICSKMTQQLNTRLQELKALIRDPCGDQLSSVQSQMNALVEQARNNDASQLRKIVSALKDSESMLKGDVERVEANLSSSLANQERSLQVVLDYVKQNNRSIESDSSRPRPLPPLSKEQIPGASKHGSSSANWRPWPRVQRQALNPEA